MKIKRFKNIGFALCLLLGGLISCEKSYEVPAINVENYGGKSNRTIAQLLRVHTTDLDLVKKNFTITGIVISSDEYNNSSKMLTIQDATRGLNILIDKSYIYNEYKIGQRVFLQCKGLGITDIDGTPQIGMIDGNSIKPIPISVLSEYLYKDSLPNVEPTPLNITKLSDVNTDMLCQLVEVKNVQFQHPNTPMAVSDSAYTLQNVIFQSTDSSMIAVKTNSKAFFASKLTPSKTGNIKGVLIKENGRYQILLRSFNDIKF